MDHLIDVALPQLPRFPRSNKITQQTSSDCILFTSSNTNQRCPKNKLVIGQIDLAWIRCRKCWVIPSEKKSNFGKYVSFHSCRVCIFNQLQLASEYRFKIDWNNKAALLWSEVVCDGENPRFYHLSRWFSHILPKYRISSRQRIIFSSWDRQINCPDIFQLPTWNCIWIEDARKAQTLLRWCYSRPFEKLRNAPTITVIYQWHTHAHYVYSILSKQR